MSKKSDTPQIILTEIEQKKFLACIATGYTIDTAAKYLGFDPNGIHSMILADAELQAQIRKAEEEAEMYFVRRIHEAAKNPNDWHAAAWWLERRKPNLYAKHKPDTLEENAVTEFFEKILQIAAKYIPKTRLKSFLKDAEKLLAQT